GAALAAPEAVPSTDGLTHLAYELLLGNVLGQPVTLDAITVLGDGAELLLLEGDELAAWMRPLGGSAPDRALEAGQQGIIYLDVTVPSPEDAPTALSHVIELTPEAAIPPVVEKPMTETIAVTTVAASAPIVIGSPVRGAGWLDGNSCCAVTPHRTAVNPVNGTLHAPERFAIDFVQLDAAGRIIGGAIDDLASYGYYGADILAVGDGPIVSMAWELPEEQPGEHPAGLALDEYGGNHIVQDLGGGRFAFYAHLQGGNPEGLTLGQTLTRGEVIGALGNSGNTDMPHLHFHIMDSPRPLSSNGLPFLIDSFTLAGTVGEAELTACMAASVPCAVDADTGSAGNDSDGGAMTETSPLYRDVIDFGG
ncbi:MAG: M23 family metallopeptidase, partial [Microterricola sp.]